MISCDSGGDDHDDDDDGDDECFVVNCDNVILFGDCEDCYGGDAKMRHFLYFFHFFYIFYPGGQAGSEVGLDQQQIRNDWKNIFNVQKYPKLIRNISTIKSSEAKCWAPNSRL